jgi:hypothetical protein
MKVGKDDTSIIVDRWDSRRIKELLTDMGCWSEDVMTPTRNESAVEGLDTRAGAWKIKTTRKLLLARDGVQRARG